jgi:hypothetical protein
VWFLSLHLISHSELVRDLPPNETLQGISVDVHTEPEASEVLATLNRIAIAGGEEEGSGDDDDDDDNDDDDQTSVFSKLSPTISPKRLLDTTVRAPTLRRPLSLGSTCTVIYNYNVYNHSVVSVDSDLTGTTINSGVDGGSLYSLPMSPRDV